MKVAGGESGERRLIFRGVRWFEKRGLFLSRMNHCCPKSRRMRAILFASFGDGKTKHK